MPTFRTLLPLRGSGTLYFNDGQAPVLVQYEVSRRQSVVPTGATDSPDPERNATIICRGRLEMAEERRVPNSGERVELLLLRGGRIRIWPRTGGDLAERLGTPQPSRWAFEVDDGDGFAAETFVCQACSVSWPRTAAFYDEVGRRYQKCPGCGTTWRPDER